MTDNAWANFFVTSLYARGSEGHILASQLRKKILEHDGREAYHCVYDLEPRSDFSGYVGQCRPVFGYIWFDFDSHDGGETALQDARRFAHDLGSTPFLSFFSGNKGFHIGVPVSALGSFEGRIEEHLAKLAVSLKSRFPTLDTSVYNANRKFRVLGSRHPKSGLFKCYCNLAQSLEEIRASAKERGSLEIPEGTSIVVSPLELFKITATEVKKEKPEKTWIAPSGDAAFAQCGFLKHCKENAKSLTEPEWYAAASIVGRFEGGRPKFHQLSAPHPGYSVQETNDKLDQALAESAPRTCENISKMFPGCAACPLYGKINSPVNIFERRFWDLPKKGNGLIPKYNELLDHFIKQHPYKTIADMKAVYVFKETHYVEYTPIEIKAFAEESFEPKPKEKERQEFTHKVFANSISRRDFFTRTTENFINFQNCVLGIETDGPIRIKNHSSEFGFRHVLPYSFDERATCITFDWWIRDVMCGDEELVKILQEYMGYVVRGGEYKYHKALWLSGSGRNGKSTFLSVLKALIGTGNYSTLSIRQIINDKFSSADLDGKIANFSEETSPEELSDSGPFKNLTGDGELLAQKKYGDPYSFRNRAKLIMTYNEVPILKDLSPGMTSRPIIIPWEKDLSAKGAQDRKLKEKLLAELPGIFNFALEGWRRLEEQEDFTYSAKSELAMQEIRDSSCSAARWISESIDFVPRPIEGKDVLRPRQLYDAYKIAIGTYAYAENKFYKRINALKEVAARRLRTEKGTEYFGMKFRQFSGHGSEF